jgi:hypothetical protein
MIRENTTIDRVYKGLAARPGHSTRASDGDAFFAHEGFSFPLSSPVFSPKIGPLGMRVFSPYIDLSREETHEAKPKMFQLKWNKTGHPVSWTRV